MHITRVLAVYRLSPLLLVMEAEDGTVVELSCPSKSCRMAAIA